METKVKVTADEKGNVVVASVNNPTYGYIRVEQTRMVSDDQGWVKPIALSALIKGKVADLEKFGWKDKQEIDGRIIIRESIVAFNKKDANKDLKRAGEDGPVLMFENAPIYRIQVWDPSGTKADETVKHTNVAEIVAHAAKTKSEKEVTNVHQA